MAKLPPPIRTGILDKLGKVNIPWRRYWEQFFDITDADGWFGTKDLADLGTKNHDDLDNKAWDVAGHDKGSLEKTVPVAADLEAVWDSEDANLPKYRQSGNLPGGITVDDVGSIGNVASVNFDIAAGYSVAEGEIAYNADEGTWDFGMPGGVVGQGCHELFFYSKNETGSIVADGKPAMFAAPIGASGKVEFQLAIADGSIPSSYIMGITTQAIGIGEFGKITWFGNVRGINTTGTPYGETWADGDLIYVGASAGTLTNVKPNVPNQIIEIAAVTVAHTNGTLLVRPTWKSKLTDLDDINGTPVNKTGQVPMWDQVNGWFDFTFNVADAYQFGFVAIYDGTQETTIAFDGTTFTLAPTGSTWGYYRNGVKYTITGSKTVVPAYTSGTEFWYIYIDDTAGTLTASQTAWTLEDTKVPVATLVINTALTPTWAMSNERHTCAIDRRWHWQHHHTEGTEVITLSSVVAGTYAVTPVTPATTDNTIGFGAGVATDEDLKVINNAITDPNGVDLAYPIIYRTADTGAASDWSWSFSEVPYSYGTTYIKWDNAGTLTEGAGNKFYNSYVLMTNMDGDDDGVSELAFIHGQGEYSTLAAAQGEEFSELDLDGIIIHEFVAIYQLTWQTSAAYTGALGRCRLAAEPMRINVSAAGGGSGVSLDHGHLVGLSDDDHTQYILVDGTRDFTGNQSLAGNDLTNIGAAYITQQDDLNGIQINGFDDRASNYQKWYISSTGAAVYQQGGVVYQYAGSTQVSQENGVSLSRYTPINFRNDVECQFGSGVDYYFKYVLANDEMTLYNATGFPHVPIFSTNSSSQLVLEGNKIIELADGTDPGDAVAVGQSLANADLQYKPDDANATAYGISDALNDSLTVHIKHYFPAAEWTKVLAGTDSTGHEVYIQNAIDHLAALDITEKKLILSEGLYSVSNPINVNYSGINIIGTNPGMRTDPGGTILKAVAAMESVLNVETIPTFDGGGDPYADNPTAYPISGLGLYNVKIDCNSLANVGWIVGSAVYKASGIRVIDPLVDGYLEYAWFLMRIETYDATNGRIYSAFSISNRSQGHRVVNGGNDYHCILAHTLGDGTGGTVTTAVSEPGVGSSWATYWALEGASGTLADSLPTINGMNAAGSSNSQLDNFYIDASKVGSAANGMMLLSGRWYNKFTNGAILYRKGDGIGSHKVTSTTFENVITNRRQGFGDFDLIIKNYSAGMDVIAGDIIRYDSNGTILDASKQYIDYKSDTTDLLDLYEADTTHTMATTPDLDVNMTLMGDEKSISRGIMVGPGVIGWKMTNYVDLLGTVCLFDKADASYDTTRLYEKGMDYGTLKDMNTGIDFISSDPQVAIRVLTGDSATFRLNNGDSTDTNLYQVKPTFATSRSVALGARQNHEDATDLTKRSMTTGSPTFISDNGGQIRIQEASNIVHTESNPRGYCDIDEDWTIEIDPTTKRLMFRQITGTAGIWLQSSADKNTAYVFTNFKSYIDQSSDYGAGAGGIYFGVNNQVNKLDSYSLDRTITGTVASVSLDADAGSSAHTVKGLMGANFTNYVSNVDATVTTVTGLEARSITTNSGAGVGTMVGLNIKDGAGSATSEDVGIEIANIASAPAGNNYAIRTGTGKVSFGDECAATSFSGAGTGLTGTAALNITGNAGGTFTVAATASTEFLPVSFNSGGAITNSTPYAVAYSNRTDFGYKASSKQLSLNGNVVNNVLEGGNADAYHGHGMSRVVFTAHANVDGSGFTSATSPAYVQYDVINYNPLSWSLSSGEVTVGKASTFMVEVETTLESSALTTAGSVKIQIQNDIASPGTFANEPKSKSYSAINASGAKSSTALSRSFVTTTTTSNKLRVRLDVDTGSFTVNTVLQSCRITITELF